MGCSTHSTTPPSERGRAAPDSGDIGLWQRLSEGWWQRVCQQKTDAVQRGAVCGIAHSGRNEIEKHEQHDGRLDSPSAFPDSPSSFHHLRQRVNLSSRRQPHCWCRRLCQRSGCSCSGELAVDGGEGGVGLSWVGPWELSVVLVAFCCRVATVLGFVVCLRPRRLTLRKYVNPFRTAVPFWGQSTWNLTVSSPENGTAVLKGSIQLKSLASLY